MLFENRRCGLGMGTDNFLGIGGCSKAKKAKSSNNEDKDKELSCWNHLPAVVLHDVFDLLSKEDRTSASLVCKNWRQNVFHCKWWPEMVFEIRTFGMARARFLRNTFGHIVSKATIRFNSLCADSVREFIMLMQVLSENNNLMSLVIEPSHCGLDTPGSQFKHNDEVDIADIVRLIKLCLPRLTEFSIGCIEEFGYYYNDILKLLDPSKVTLLGLASVKDVLDNGYQKMPLSLDLLTSFEKLKILSIDYDHVSDEFLNCLRPARQLERLVIHLHDVPDDHPSTSNHAWAQFRIIHPKCGLRLSVIHAFNAILDLPETVLKTNMPLTHLKVFFCEKVSYRTLECISGYYSETIRSVMWVDSYTENKSSWVFNCPTEPEEQNPDPIVLMAWLCKRLEELVFFGYKYPETNLMAIGRLRGPKLKKLEIAEDDIVDDGYKPLYIKDVPKNLGRPWAPIPSSKLHPVLKSPMEGDSDEYLLPIVLADLH